jgi:hypothetical protein
MVAQWLLYNKPSHWRELIMSPKHCQLGILPGTYTLVEIGELMRRKRLSDDPKAAPARARRFLNRMKAISWAREGFILQARLRSAHLPQTSWSNIH